MRKIIYYEIDSMHFRGFPIWRKLYSYIKSSRPAGPYVNLKKTERISDIDCGFLVYPTWICKCNRTYSRSSGLEVFCKNGALRNFAKFTGKHLCQSLIFNKVAGGASLTTHNTTGGCFWCSFFIMFFFYCLFFPFVIMFNVIMLLLGKTYFNATTLSKVITKS